MTFPSKIAKIRYAAIHSALAGWDTACTRDNCDIAAKITGTFPCDVNEPLKSKYVRTLTQKEMDMFNKRREYAQNHFLVSGKLLTDADIFGKMMEHILQRPDLSHLYTPVVFNDRIASYVEIVQYFSTFEKNGCKSLSRFSPFYAKNSPPVYFQ